jgi:DNA-binding transcriptional ArsR family regulator
VSEAGAATLDPLLARLDRLTLLLELALAPQIEARRTELRADPIDAAIFDHTANAWVPASKLRQKVKAKPRTLQSHLAKLIEAGLVEHRGGKRYAEYRSAGLI